MKTQVLRLIDKCRVSVQLFEQGTDAPIATGRLRAQWIGWAKVGGHMFPDNEIETIAFGRDGAVAITIITSAPA